MDKPTEIQALQMGWVGAKPTEEERLLFEAWMRGHCWKVCGEWNGTTYVSDHEGHGDVDPHAMRTRQLWAAWRDRAALSNSAYAQCRSDERERCAKLCETKVVREAGYGGRWEGYGEFQDSMTGDECATAIRGSK